MAGAGTARAADEGVMFLFVCSALAVSLVNVLVLTVPKRRAQGRTVAFAERTSVFYP